MMFRRNASAYSGQSLVELIIGIAIAAIIVGSVVGAVVLSVRINKQSIATTNASALGQELVDKVRSVSEGNWTELYGLSDKSSSSTYYISPTTIIFSEDWNSGSSWDISKWTDDDINGGLHDIQSLEGHLRTSVTDDSGARTRAIGSVHTDAELLVKWRKGAVNPVFGWGLRFWLRASNDWPSPECTPDAQPGQEPCEGYGVLMQEGDVELWVYTSSSQTKLGDINYADDTSWHWLRFRVEDDQLKVRVWADGASEPSVWNMEVTDSNLTSGVLQINAWSKLATVYNWYIDDLTLSNTSSGIIDLGIATGTEDIVKDGITYTRWFSVENVSRDDVTGDIVEGGGVGTTEDSSTQKITTYVQWDVGGDTANVSLVEFFTRSTRNTAIVFTDWSGASGAEGIITDPTSNFSTSTVGIDFSIPGEIFLTTASTSTVSWYNSAWKRRRKISVDSMKVPSILTDFPMLISRTEALWAGDQADGGGFLFTSSDGTTKIDHEIERYNQATGELIAWVEIPTLASSTGTDIYIYYKNTTGGLDEQNVTGTWSNGYVGVWHLEETCSDDVVGCIKDSTGNNDATAKQFNDGGGGTTNATGKLGGADLFSGEPCAGGGCDYHQIPADSSLDVQDNYTVSLWAFQQGAADPIGRYFSSVYNTGLGFWMDNSGTVGTAYHINNADWPDYRIHESNGQNLDIWEHLAFTVNGTIGKIYRDASEQTLSIDNITGTPNDSGINGAYIGIYLPTHEHRFEGKLDEVRLSNVTRSQDWITTGFNSQSSPSTFYTIGAQEDSP